jgi:hypothetical protein
MSTLSTAARNAACDAVVDLVDAGTPPGRILLRASSTTVCTINFENTAYGAASTGVATAASFPKSNTAAATGVLDNYVIENNAGTDIITGTIGEGSGDISFDNTDINSGQTVTLSSLTHTQPAS